MNLLTAQHYADKIVAWLTPFAQRLFIAGSIRRERPECADVDIVLIPKVTEHKDLMGEIVARDNHVLQFLQDYVKDRNPTAGKIDGKPWFVSGGEKEGKQLVMMLPGEKRQQAGRTPNASRVPMQLDLWFASEQNFASRLLCRTGSKEHNPWLADRFTERGYHWFIYEGVAKLEDLAAAKIDYSAPGAADRAREAGLIKNDSIEQELYRRAGLQFIEPQNREIEWLKRNVDSGLEGEF